jgi:hypothetical protein
MSWDVSRHMPLGTASWVERSDEENPGAKLATMMLPRFGSPAVEDLTPAIIHYMIIDLLQSLVQTR